MQCPQPFVSILTPTWNRAAYLNRVWKGLESQTYKNFEWIVANDGSLDDTVSVIEALASRSNFPVILMQASVRIGKARMDNESIAQASGKFILWNDSDDFLLPNALQRLVETWNSIPSGDQDDYVGITALCADDRGVISSPYHGPIDVTWNDLSGKHGVKGDMALFTRASALKANRFPEVDFVIPEGVVWTKLADMKTRFCPEVVMIKEYRAPYCISFSGKMEYCRGRAYAMAGALRAHKSSHQKLQIRLWDLITFIRLCVHGDISLSDQAGMWSGNSSRMLFFSMWPVGWAFAIKDHVQRKVRKTHLEFLRASRVVTISRSDIGRVFTTRS